MPIVPPSNAPDQSPAPLENGVSLSQSLIWRLQREFYVQRGLKAWAEDLVPNFITSNPFIAEIYAGIVAGFLGDCMELSHLESKPLSPERPLRILELGAGAGKFSYLFLRRLKAVLCAQDIPLQTVRYCMTDCSERLIEDWRANGYLREFVECGVLEFELLQAGEQINSQFLGGRNSGMAAQSNAPLVLIANYVFDSLPQDAFVIKDGCLSEAMVTTMRRDGASGTDEALSGLQFSYENADVPRDRYPDQSWNNILELYRSRLPAATVFFPSAALKTLQHLSSLTNGRMLVLAADKGFAHEEDLQLAQGPPTLEFHAANQCFSQIVNFDAIGKYFEAAGGKALLPDKHFSGLNICAFLQRRPGDQFPATKAAYRASQAAYGPDDLFTLLAWLNAHMEEMSVPQILSTLRLTRWDPVALMRMFPVLARQLRTVSAERNDLRNAVMRTWANHFPVAPGENVIAFQCGVILLELRFFDDALSMFKESERIFSRSAATSYNMGLCAQGLGRPSEALAFMVEACEQDPNFEPARLARAKLVL